MHFRNLAPLFALLCVLLLIATACSPFGDDEDGEPEGPTATIAGEVSETPPGTSQDAANTPESEAEGTGTVPPSGQGTATTPAEEATPTEVGTPAPAPSPPAEGLFGFGTPASDEAIAEVDIDIPPDGSGLPDGSGTPSEGEEVYANECAACHGETGREGGIGGVLVSEPGPYETGMPRTIGSYWPYATTLYDYTNRAMPFDEPGSLEPDQIYAVVAYLLHENQIIAEDEEMNADTLPQVEMPNRESFFPCWPDTCRPDVTPAP